MKNPLRHRVHDWQLVRTGWPYKEGYGTRCRGCRMVVDTGMSRAGAMELLADLRKNNRTVAVHEW